jgi:hypothetical protein
VPRNDGLRLDDVHGERQPRQACESRAHNMRSADVKRRRGRRERFTTPSWCRSAMISRCNEARDRTMNRSEWNSETTTDVTNEGYRTTLVTSIDATRTAFLVATARGTTRRPHGWREVCGARDLESAEAVNLTRRLREDRLAQRPRAAPDSGIVRPSFVGLRYRGP